MINILHILKLFLLFSSINSLEWTPNSWKNKKVYQNVLYPNEPELNNVLDEISKNSPLIFAGESDSLKNELIKASKGESFILMGGDCAETFREFSSKNIMDTYRVFLQMTLILMYGTSKPVIKIGRMAGQFAKPRSNEFETINNLTLNAYRGDIINLEPFDIKNRTPNPQLMIKAYSQSAQTMNLLRALSEGGYANIERINEWNLDFVRNTENGYKYQKFAEEVKRSLNFLKTFGVDNLEETKRARFYTGHEALLLPYESALTRIDSISNKYYDCSAHMIWLGERTRQIDGAHIEFASGIENPIGIKLSENVNYHELYELIRKLNPLNKPGKIILIPRMGDKIEKGLSILVDLVNTKKLNVVFLSDPMHANTIKLSNGIKTRYLDKIKEEFTFFYNFLKKNGLHAGGIHLEMTGKDVTECLYSSNEKYDIDNIFTQYDSSCDPRLNANQCIDLAFYIASLYS
jgi:3-deoxy-7-phosphoheptulonate synthase